MPEPGALQELVAAGRAPLAEWPVRYRDQQAVGYLCSYVPEEMIHAAGFQHDGFGRDIAGFKNLGPAETEPAIANDQTFFTGHKLTRHRFHSIGAAAGNDNNGLGIIRLF